MNNHLSEYSPTELVRMLGTRFKDYRLRANLTQKEVAEMTGLSVLTVHRFENGSVKNISLGTFLLLLKAVGCIDDLNELMPEQPESPYLYKENQKKMQRVSRTSSSVRNCRPKRTKRMTPVRDTAIRCGWGVIIPGAPSAGKTS